MKLPQVRIRFNDCKDGWIRFAITVGKQATTLSASNLYDPFLDMIRWLERVAAGRHRSSFTMDMEGVKAQVVAVDKANDHMLFEIQDPDRDTPPPIRAIVDRRQLVHAIYSAFTRFASSKQYMEEEWAPMTLGDRLERVLPSLSPKQILATAARLDRNTLCKVFFNAAPSYQISFEGQKSLEDGFRRWLKHVLHPDDKDAGKGLIETPEEWELPDDFDSWPVTRRKNYLRELFQERVNTWDGHKLNELSSRVIEDYLGHTKG